MGKRVKPFEECSEEEQQRRLDKVFEAFEREMERPLTDKEIRERERFARMMSYVSVEDMFKPFTI